MWKTLYTLGPIALIGCANEQIKSKPSPEALAAKTPTEATTTGQVSNEGSRQKETTPRVEEQGAPTPIPGNPAKPDYRSVEASFRLQMIQQIKAGGGDAEDGQISNILDFLIQDVCMDPNGRTTSEDPAFCASRRNVAFGEPLPYFKTDVGPEYPAQIKAGWQRSDSVPFQDKNGIWHVIKTFDFGGAWMPGKHWGVFEDFQDGYDVTELKGPFTSYSLTKDSINDVYFAGRQCAHNDGWILFPWNIAKGVSGNVAHDIFLFSVREICSDKQKNSASAAWHWFVEKMIYSSNKVLETITTHHWSHPNSTESTSFEMNYYTKEYGATRWEAWEKCPNGLPCVAPSAANICNGSTTQVINGSHWKRNMCRDWTVISPSEVAFPTSWVDHGRYRICLYGTGKFGDGTTCVN